MKSHTEICEWCDRPVENGRTHGEDQCFDGRSGEPIDPIITKIMRGMRLVNQDDSTEWWEVEAFSESSNATLRSNDARRIIIPYSDISKYWSLYENFNPRKVKKL